MRASSSAPGPPPPPIMRAISPPLFSAHGLHHVGHLPVHLDELVDVLDLGAGARRDAPLALAVEDLRANAAPLASSSVMMACWRFRTLSSRLASADLRLDLAHAGQHAEHARHAADALHLLELFGRDRRDRTRPSSSSGRSPSPFRCRSFCGRLLHQRHHIAHAENAAGDTRG